MYFDIRIFDVVVLDFRSLTKKNIYIDWHSFRQEKMDDTNETSFVVDEVSNVIKESIEATIGSQSYQQAKINTWTSNIVEAILNSLTKLNKPFKYIVSCVIMQKNGAGLHTASSCFWDNTTDGSCTVR